jgi:threonine dehydrogenase-like Zn-dependent dehydrogenase
VTESARAFWIGRPGQGEIREEPIETAGPDEVVVRARFSGISRGTEALVFQGRVPSSEHERMRAPFQRGRFPAPVKYGYANVGLVERGPREIEGRHVFVLYPHQTRYVVPAAAAHTLPAGVPPERAVLAANLETAINAVWDGRPQIGDRVAVIGGGTIGCLIAWLTARLPGTGVELVDLNPRRAPVARALGASFSQPPQASPDADIVFHASGSPGGLQLALQLAGFEATIVDVSWYGDRQVPLALGEAFHARRLTISSSQVATVAASQHARWDTRRRMQLSLSLLADEALDVLITGESEFESLPDVMARLAVDPGDTLCHRIRYGD